MPDFCLRLPPVGDVVINNSFSSRKKSHVHYRKEFSKNCCDLAEGHRNFLRKKEGDSLPIFSSFHRSCLLINHARYSSLSHDRLHWRHTRLPCRILTDTLLSIKLIQSRSWILAHHVDEHDSTHDHPVSLKTLTRNRDSIRDAACSIKWSFAESVLT